MKYIEVFHWNKGPYFLEWVKDPENSAVNEVGPFTSLRAAQCVLELFAGDPILIKEKNDNKYSLKEILENEKAWVDSAEDFLAKKA